MEEKQQFEKVAKLGLVGKIGLGTLFYGGEVLGTAKKALGEFDTVNKTKEYYKTGFRNGVKPVSANNKFGQQRRPDRLLGTYPAMQYQEQLANTENTEQEKLAANDDNHFRDAYKFIPVGAGLAIAGAGAVQVARGKMAPGDLVKPVKNVAKAAFRPFKTITNVSESSINIANKIRKEKELADEFLRYKQRTGDLELSEEGFKAIMRGLEEGNKKFYNKTPKNVDEYIRRNKDRLFDQQVFNSAKTKAEKNNSYRKKFNNFFQKTFDDSLSGLVVSGTMGAGLTGGALAINALGDEYYKHKDNKEMRKYVRDHWNKNIPNQILLKKDNKLEANLQPYYTPEEKMEMLIRDEVRQTAKKELRKQQNNFNRNRNTGNRNRQQKPNNRRNQNFKQQQVKPIEKSAAVRIPKMSDKTKKFIGQNIITDSAGALAYAVAPATMFGLMNRDRYNFAKIDSPRSSENQKKKTQPKTKKTVLEFKDEDTFNKQMQKDASVKLKDIKKYGKKIKKDFIPADFKQQMGDRAVRGIVNTVPVAVVAGITNRNLRGNMESFDSEQYSQNVARPLERGNIRVTIERGDDDK